MNNKIIAKNSDIKIKYQELGLLNRLVLITAYKSYYSLIYKLIQIFLHVSIPSKSYTKKLRMPHPFAIQLNKNTELGNNITIYQNCTVGSAQFGNKIGTPIIGDNVIIYPNSVIIGKIRIGDNAIIAAGSVVIKDVEKNTVVAGNPAKIIGIIS